MRTLFLKTLSLLSEDDDSEVTKTYPFHELQQSSFIMELLRRNSISIPSISAFLFIVIMSNSIVVSCDENVFAIIVLHTRSVLTERCHLLISFVTIVTQ